MNTAETLLQATLANIDKMDNSAFEALLTTAIQVKQNPPKKWVEQHDAHVWAYIDGQAA